MENTEKVGFAQKLDNFFKIKERGSNFKTEILAGLVTFLAMAYILTVNPNQIFNTASTSDPLWSSVFMATAFGAIIGTILMSVVAKLPLAQAPGMGLNAQVGGLIGGASGAFATGAAQFSLGQAMMLVLISGIIFLALSIINIECKSLRQYIFEGIPTSLKVAIPSGIGLFIAFIGFQNAGVIVTNGFTQVGMISFKNWDSQLAQWGMVIPEVGQVAQTYTTAQAAAVCFIGLFAIAIMSHFKIKGAVIFGILFATVIGIPMGVTNVSVITGNEGISWKFWNNFADFFSCGDKSTLGIAFSGEGWSAFGDGKAFVAIMTIISFSMIDMFDTMGTCLGCCSEAGLLDENGTPIAYDKIMYADSIATCTGALLGTSTVTTFVESGAGIAAGGKTGLTALVTAILFFLSMFLMPVFAMIPSAAAASALVYVGVLMMKNITKVNFDAIRVAVPAFLTIIMMPLAYSITTGIGVGILSFVIISIITYLIDLIKFKACKDDSVEKPEWKISVFTGIVAILFGVYFFVPF
ncbi:MAG: NCS2 family permease [Firmicutes bacterium]|nr:NCS2 family permease [Candidatus Caballimonas caccae]